MPVTYASTDTQRSYPTPEGILPDTISDVQSPISPRSPDAAPKSFLGFTPPRDEGVHLHRSHLHRSHLARMRKSKHRNVAVRGIGADGGGG